MIKIVKLKFYDFLEQFNFIEMLRFFKKLLIAILIVLAFSNLNLFVHVFSLYNYIFVKLFLSYLIVFKINYSDPKTKKILKKIFTINFDTDHVKKDKTDLFVDTLFKGDLSMNTITKSFGITQKEYISLIDVLISESVVYKNKGNNNKLELQKNITKSDIYNALLKN